MRNPLVNDGRHIYNIISTTICSKHDAGEGMPCFEVNPGSKAVPTAVLSGVCGRRIRRAGYNGKISPTSFQSRRPSGPNDRKPFPKKKEATR